MQYVPSYQYLEWGFGSSYTIKKGSSRIVLVIFSGLCKKRFWVWGLGLAILGILGGSVCALIRAHRCYPDLCIRCQEGFNYAVLGDGV